MASLVARFGSYFAAVASVLLIAFAEVGLHVPVGDKSRFLVMLIPVAVSTWIGGKGPGLAGLVLSSLVGASLLPPKYSLAVSSPEDVVSELLYVVVSLVLIGIIESLKQSREALAASERIVKNLNADLTKNLGKKEEAIQLQKQFISDASHELKTPLTAIRVRSGIALGGPAEASELVEHIAAINRAAEVMICVVQDLLLLAASDEEKLHLRKEPSSMQELVEDALASVDALKHQVKLSIDPKLEVNCDPSAITRVLVNLLQNAVIHTREGKGIQITVIEAPKGVTVTIRDEGKGIPEEHLERIFDRFHRVDVSRDRKSGGTGLGLAIAKAIIEAHGGTIEIKSLVDVGTAVTLTIPR